MSAIDHKTDAIDALEVARNASHDNVARTHAIIAQAEATLALVEQQRLANLIQWTAREGHTPTPDVQRQITEGLSL